MLRVSACTVEAHLTDTSPEKQRRNDVVNDSRYRSSPIRLGAHMDRIISKAQVSDVIELDTGERIYELIGKSESTGATMQHSVAHCTLPPGKSTKRHYHKVSEETYYILQGNGHLLLDKATYRLSAGQACLIRPGQVHHFTNDGHTTIEYLAVCAPGWIAEDSVCAEDAV